LTITVTLLSAPMRTNALGSKVPAATITPPALPGPAACAHTPCATTPSVRPAPALRKSRRLRLTIPIPFMRASYASVAVALLDRGADAVVGAAAADVTAHRGVDVGIARLAFDCEQRRRAHDLARLAVAALRHVLCNPGRLHRLAGLAGAHPLDRGDPFPGDCRDGGNA